MFGVNWECRPQVAFQAFSAPMLIPCVTRKWSPGLHRTERSCGGPGIAVSPFWRILVFGVECFFIFVRVCVFSLLFIFLLLPIRVAIGAAHDGSARPLTLGQTAS